MHMIRGALVALLSLEDDMQVIAELERGDQIVPAALETRPNVAVIDIDLPGLDGLTAAEQLYQRLPECQTLVLTGLSQPGNLLRALKVHVRGFIVKDAPAETLANGVRPLRRGGPGRQVGLFCCAAMPARGRRVAGWRVASVQAGYGRPASRPAPAQRSPGRAAVHDHGLHRPAREITEIDILADPVRLRQLDLTVLNDRPASPHHSAARDQVAHKAAICIRPLDPAARMPLR